MNGNPVGAQPPMVAFGSQGGGTPLYINQDYHFGIVCGGQDFGSLQPNSFQIEVYNKNDFDHGAVNVPPLLFKIYDLRKLIDKESCDNFASNAYLKEYYLKTNINNTPIDFETQIQYASIPGINNSWGQGVSFPLAVKHKANNPNYCYKISFRGFTVSNDGTTWTTVPMAKNITQTAQSCNVSYPLDFDNPAPWSSELMTLPHFQTEPMPSSYAGISLENLVHQAPEVSGSLPPPDEVQKKEWTMLNNSPELKTHPLLEELITNIGTNSYAIANYVQNEIELTDVLGWNVADRVDPTSINPQGMMRDALATYLDGQGSPIEQCALLVYLL